MSPETNVPARQAAVTGLAIVGFLALVGAGMWLAVYSSRYVPSVASGLGTAAVYVGSIFSPHHPASLAVVPEGTTTVPFETGTSTTATSTATTTTPTSKPSSSTTVSKPSKPATTPGEETSTQTQISGTTPAPLSGLPDLVVKIEAVGYLASTTPGSFVATTTVPKGMRPAVKFVISNVGTNVAGPWRFSASIPTQTAFIYQSPSQQALNPGDSIEYTLGFDQAIPGSDKMISITANFDHAVLESSLSNDSAASTLTILGS